MAGYDISTDADINKYDTDDLKDLTKAGMGEGARELVISTEFIVFMAIAIFLVGLIVVLIAKTRKIGK